MRFKYLLIYIFIFIALQAKAQSLEEAQIRDILESVAENLPDDYDLSELIEVLGQLKKHPINLNNTNPEELKAILFLTPLQISNFFAYLKENERLIDVLELQSIDAFDTKTVESLLPFVTVNESSAYEKLSFRNLNNFGNHDVLLRAARTLEKQKGYTDLPGNRYLGTPEKIQTRYRYQFETILSVALTVDKDAGETLMGKPVDFYSGNVAIFKLGRIQKLIVGDYALQFGQGLTLWSGFSFGKGPDITGVVKKDLGLRPYNSANEYSFFRGLSATINLFKNITITPFISYRKLDASQQLDSLGNLVQATINQTGLHRTPSEIENKNTLTQQAYGTVIQYSKNDFSFGAIGYQNKFSQPFITQTALYDKDSFTGKSLTNIGLYGNYTYRNIYFFGEAAKSLNSGSAYLGGALISLSPQVSAAILYRNYAPNYHNFFNQAISEATEATNEKGLYAGLNITPNKKWIFSFYGDYFKFPWLKYRINGPSDGYEILSQAVYSPKKTLRFLARFKTENKLQNNDLNTALDVLDQVKREGYRVEINWQLNKTWSFENRIEFSQFKKGNSSSEFGRLIYQDVNYQPPFSKISANMRLAYFNTPSYNSRIYAYEDDVLYSFAFGLYNGKGFRSYFNIKYSLGKKLNFWARYGLFIYQETTTIGTYLDEIQGNKKSEIKIQMRYQF